MAFTVNYNLKKPELDEQYDIAHQNGNMDIIDNQLGILASYVPTKLNLSGGTMTGSLFVGAEGHQAKLEASTGYIYSNGAIVATQAWVQANDKLPDVVTFGTSGCKIDCTNGMFRIRGLPGQSSIVARGDNSTIEFYLGDATIAQHVFRKDGTKAGGSIKIDGVTLGMSPIDSPRIQIQDIIRGVKATPAGTAVTFEKNFMKSIEDYSVFPSIPVTIKDKTKDGFVVVGDGEVDLQIIGDRVGCKKVYWQEMPSKEV